MAEIQRIKGDHRMTTQGHPIVILPRITNRLQGVAAPRGCCISCGALYMHVEVSSPNPLRVKRGNCSHSVGRRESSQTRGRLSAKADLLEGLTQQRATTKIKPNSNHDRIGLRGCSLDLLSYAVLFHY
jgi:hypothetical protein